MKCSFYNEINDTSGVLKALFNFCINSSTVENVGSVAQKMNNILETNIECNVFKLFSGHK